jgi:hypothetical protein
MKNTTTKKDITFPKTGTNIPAGTLLTVYFDSERNSRVFLDPKGTPNRRCIRLENAHKYLTGFSKPPGMMTLERYSNDGVAKTPTGHRVEPDGYGPDESPSWLLVIGVI